jgi:hypothetical protein
MVTLKENPQNFAYKVIQTSMNVVRLVNFIGHLYAGPLVQEVHCS